MTFCGLSFQQVMTIVTVSVLVVCIGYCFAKWTIQYLHRSIYRAAGKSDYGWSDYDKKRAFALDWFLGGTERLIALMLTLFSPNDLSVFVGGWVAAKLASNWHRDISDCDDIEKKVRPRLALASLVGSAVSFGAAVGTGLLLREFLPLA